LAAIHHEVSQNDDLLSCFGSFFFILDAQGIKLLSKQCGPGETAFQVLQKIVPSLDWDYMLDKANGELYLDPGVFFSPDKHHRTNGWSLATGKPLIILCTYGKIKQKQP
jgi:hypothetical protein